MWGERQSSRSDFGAGRGALWTTVLMGLVFMAAAGLEYTRSLEDAYTLQRFLWIDLLRDDYSSCGARDRGFAAACYVGILPRYGYAGSPHRLYRTVALYWHFVDASGSLSC